jgi:hypothetical protein
MIARYLARRVMGALIRLGRTLRGQERRNTPKAHNQPVWFGSRPAQRHTGG